MCEDKWDQLRKRLLAMGWFPETIGEIAGLSSPFRATFVHRDAMSDEQRHWLIDAVQRRVQSMRGENLPGISHEVASGQLRDFEQLHDALRDVYGELGR